MPTPDTVPARFPCRFLRAAFLAGLGLTSLSAGCGDGSTGIGGDVWLIGDVPLFDIQPTDAAADQATPPDQADDSGEDSTPTDTQTLTDSQTPADAAPDATEPPLEIGWCRLHDPITATLNTSESMKVTGRLLIVGLTDQTSGNDPDPRVLGRVVVGSANTDPADWDVFFDASHAPDWDAGPEAGQDAWRAVVGPIALPGAWDFAFAFSGDGGRSWTYCDRDAGTERDGSEDGYASENAGKLTVVIDPCAASNPCTIPPNGCNGNILEVWTSPGTCSASGADFTCNYGEPATTLCDADPSGYCDAETRRCRTDPCRLAPCTTRAPSCDGNTRVTWSTPGTCITESDTTFRCDFNVASRTDCGGATPFCHDGTCHAWRFPVAGDLLISEMMVRPAAVSAENGQWFELKVMSQVPLNLQGVSFTSNTHTATVASELIVAPGSFHVFARQTNSLLNGGVEGAHPLTAAFSLNATGDVLTIARSGGPLARVNYGATGTAPLDLTPPVGAALQLDRDATAANDRVDWCAATTPFGTGDRGTPGAANGFCRQPIGWCRFQAPTTTTLTPNTAFSLFGRFFAPGLTNNDTNANDPSPLIRAAFAIEPEPVRPNPADWNWVAAAANPSYGPASPGFEPANDEWFRQVSTPATPGAYRLAFRVSGDQGSTWTYCDRNLGPGADGSENGFSTNDTATLSVTNPCLPNPCNQPPAPFCSGDSIVNPATTGVCTISGPSFSCDYAAGGFTTPCPAFCADGACEEWRYPTAPGDLLITEIFASATLGQAATWFELHNPTAAPLNLAGLRVTTVPDATFEPSATFILEPGAWLVIGASADTTVNGEVSVDLVMPDLALDPDRGTLTLSRNNVVIDEVAWTPAWPRGLDISTSLAPALLAAPNPHLQNDNAANWCLGTTAFDSGAFGTPGAPNSSCATGVGILRTVPANGSASVAVDAPIVINFSVPMNATSLVTQTAFGACTGTIQLSYNDFASCVPFNTATPALSAGGSTATLTPAPHLTHGLAWKLRVLATVASSNGTQLGSDFTSTFTTTTPFACGGAAIVVISQVYGAGGNSGATLTHDYVELHNRSRKPVTLNGWSLRYAGATGTNWSGVTNLEGVIAPGGFFLVRQSGGVNGAALPTADQEGTIAMAASAGKIALLVGQGTNHPAQACPDATRVIDFVAYGTGVNCAEGSENTGTPATSTTAAAWRDVAGCVDRNTNQTDFLTGPPAPRNSASRAVFCACPDDVINNDRTPPLAAEADYCALSAPTTVSAVRGAESAPIEGRVFEGGLTDTTSGAAPGILAELAVGRTTSNPLGQVDWALVPGVFAGETDGGNNDAFKTTLPALMVNTARNYHYTWRFSVDNGQSWTWCDSDGAGSNPNLVFNPDALGVLTVTLP